MAQKKHTINGKHIEVLINKSFDISNIDVTSLIRHASGKKHLEIQISRSSNIGAAFFGKSNTRKSQTNDKEPDSKDRQKVKEQWKVN